MSVTFAYGPGTYNLGRLSNEIVAGGVTLVTIRGDTANIEVECADGTVQATVDALVAAHSGATPPPHDYPVLDGTVTKWVRADGTIQVVSAAVVSNAPAGSIAATNVQAALNELDSEKEATGTAAAAVAVHEGAADPHTGYQKETEKNAANGYAGLDAASRTTKGVDTTDDVIVDNNAKGVVLKSPDGHYWRVSVSNLGVLTTTDLGTTKP